MTKESLDTYYDELGTTLGEALLAPTRIYVKALKNVKNAGVTVKACSHITGGGFDENIPRILKDNQGIEVVEGSWNILPVFNFLEKYGKIPHREMFNIYNMGIGMVIAMPENEAGKAIEILKAYGDTASVIGKVTDKPGVNIIMK